MTSSRRRTRRARVVVIAIGASSAALVSAACFAAWPRIVEIWHIQQLGSKDASVREAAAKSLGRSRSERSLLALFRAAADDPAAVVRLSAEHAIFGRVDPKTPGDVAALVERLVKSNVSEGGADLLRIYRVIGRSFQAVLKDLGVKDYPLEIHSYDDLIQLVRRFTEATRELSPP